jgi:hypothetical protein
MNSLGASGKVIFATPGCLGGDAALGAGCMLQTAYERILVAKQGAQVSNFEIFGNISGKERRIFLPILPILNIQG